MKCASAPVDWSLGARPPKPRHLPIGAAALAAYRYALTGYADRPHTLGSQLCALRELIFPELKQARA